MPAIHRGWLEMLGWLQREGPPLLPKAWRVDPRVHEMFAERAEQERERREQVRNLIMEQLEMKVNCLNQKCQNVTEARENDRATIATCERFF